MRQETEFLAVFKLTCRECGRKMNSEGGVIYTYLLPCNRRGGSEDSPAWSRKIPGTRPIPLWDGVARSEGLYTG
jgi:hypothetical protein